MEPREIVGAAGDGVNMRMQAGDLRFDFLDEHATF